MKKPFSFLFIFIVSLLFITTSLVLPVYAQSKASSSAILPPVPNSGGQLILGQNHYYSVVFRGNGEAIVLAKLVLNNADQGTINDFTFQLPTISPYEMVIYQQKLPKTCRNYSYQSGTQVCTEYSDPDYNSSYYYGSNAPAEYQKITYSVTDHTYHFSLPYPVESFKSSALIVSYATKSFVTNQFGLFKYNFETIKVDSRINDLRVSIDVDSDLYLKGKTAAVNYGQSAKGESLTTVAPSSINSASLDRIVGTIGNSGVLTKEAKNLAPNESFSVKGEYASSWWRLYVSSLIICAVIIIGIILVLWFTLQYYNKKSRQIHTHEISTQKMSKTLEYQSIILPATLLGFVSAVLGVIVIYLSLFLSRLPLISYSYGDLPRLLFSLIILLLFVLAIFGPAIYAASKYSMKAILLVIIAEILWFILFFTIFVLLFPQTPITQPYPVPVAL